MVSSHLQGAEAVYFLVSSLWLDAAVTVPLVWLALSLLRRPRWNAARRAFLAVSLACSPLVVANAVRFEVLRYSGDAVEFRILRNVAGGDVANFFYYASAHLLVWLVILLTGVVGGR